MAESTLAPQSALVDLLDRVLDRGLIINADIIISLAGVPLIGITLRAALAGMETMVQYGVMQEWDERIRAQAMGDGQSATRALPGRAPRLGTTPWITEGHEGEP